MIKLADVTSKRHDYKRITFYRVQHKSNYLLFKVMYTTKSVYLVEKLT